MKSSPKRDNIFYNYFSLKPKEISYTSLNKIFVFIINILTYNKIAYGKREIF